jgi:hypothetical protein
MATTFTTKLVQFATAAGTLHAAKLWLVEHAPKLTKAEKVEADAAVVKALAKHYGIDYAKAQKNGKLSMLCFPRAGGDESYKKAVNCATVALHRSRAILLSINAKKPDPEVRVQQRIDASFAFLKAQIESGNPAARRAAKALVNHLKV